MCAASTTGRGLVSLGRLRLRASKSATFISSLAFATKVAAATRERRNSSKGVMRVTNVWRGRSAEAITRSKAASMDSSSGNALWEEAHSRWRRQYKWSVQAAPLVVWSEYKLNSELSST